MQWILHPLLLTPPCLMLQIRPTHNLETHWETVGAAERHILMELGVGVLQYRGYVGNRKWRGNVLGKSRWTDTLKNV